MAHFDGKPPRTTPTEQARAVVAFLHRCRSWATDREIPKIEGRLAEEHTRQDAVKLHEWLVWRDFIDHALVEIDSGKLDPWFEDDVTADER